MTEFAGADAATAGSAVAPATAPVRDNFRSTHLWWPLAVFLAAFGLIEALGLDRRIAHALFFDSATHAWLGGGAGDAWARRLIHNDGRWLVRGVAAAALVGWLASLLVPRARQWRRSAGFVLLSMVAAVGLVGGLKSVTNVDCPWDLAEFGGSRPYVTLFGDRPDALPRAQCFPGAHSSSGFALLCFYFLWRDRSRRAARLALLAALLVGTLFTVGQEARGAHFLSHDLTSAAIVWFVQLGLYVWLLKPRAAAPTPIRADTT
jgi:membrane-associated PAP2 superfamily phosphatase